MRKLTLITGQLSEVQIKNLKMYPLIYFDDVKEVTMSYDIVTDPAAALPGKGSQILYEIEFNEDANPSMIDKRMMALRSSVQFILWSNVTVVVVDKKTKKSYE